MDFHEALILSFLLAFAVALSFVYALYEIEYSEHYWRYKLLCFTIALFFLSLAYTHYIFSQSEWHLRCFQ